MLINNNNKKITEIIGFGVIFQKCEVSNKELVTQNDYPLKVNRDVVTNITGM